MPDDLDFSAQMPKRDPGVHYVPPPPVPPPPVVEYVPPAPRADDGERPPPAVPYRLYRPGVVEPFLFICAGAGVLMLAVAAYLHGPLLALVVTGEYADGTVVGRDRRLAGVIVRRGVAIRVHDTGFRVAFAADGVVRETWFWARGEYPGWAVGEPFPVVYPPGDPDAAVPASFQFQLETDRALWFSLCLAGFGVAAAGGGLVGGLRLRRRRVRANALLAAAAA